MKIFIDTNVFLDYILSRQVGFVEANELFMLSANYQIDLMLSDLTLANVRYVTRRDFTNEIFYEVINDMRDLFEIAPIGPNAVDRALVLRANDFEDALQYFSAIQSGADCIVTRNAKDFSFSEIEVLTPSDFLAKYYPQQIS